MSQKKMDAYKYAKKHKKEIEKKQKRNKFLAWAGGILVAAILIAASVYLVYYTQNQADTSSEDIVEDVTDIIEDSINVEGEDAEIEVEDVTDDVEIDTEDGSEELEIETEDVSAETEE